ncbi:MAG: DUF899 domain-containing protein [Hoeflea sp.]|uniref:DUF899 domain-containing protein n=1 Tax=Hoeflea sp. TaxID=1940281 RepID=UPI001D9F96C0|nr:DUF899 domain-containing protein [Hoeflea sp.]MBU4530066.1 DUF899 domain-containing protein [Alphaproteobacteria bacterium]MBU4542649.1 DUF899 domain-containing protein [Alphaproteobacteria bacterium]MBU4551330.1 DUF899 domain-containing protein [Alphaproteobacteria bacterium]MBV1723153.1 DUF899 domain-containing protein [Hoeflea sp.]MBV1760164.1 DUF899 domain-containing protein [Hoeflea sp.]
MNRIVEEAEWMDAYARQVAQEKAATEALDRIAADRRRLPWLRVEKDYRFTGPTGETGLEGLFEGRSQLIVYHHMLKPNDPAPCAGCSMVGDHIPHLAHINARDVTLVFVARAPSPEIERYKRRMGWTMPFYQSIDSFGSDFGIDGGFGLNVFLNTDAGIMRTYYTSGRGVETLGTPMTLLDITPFGRQETWEESPEGVAQGEPYVWWRRHDEYDPHPSAPSAVARQMPQRASG